MSSTKPVWKGIDPTSQNLFRWGSQGYSCEKKIQLHAFSHMKKPLCIIPLWVINDPRFYSIFLSPLKSLPAELNWTILVCFWHITTWGKINKFYIIVLTLVRCIYKLELVLLFTSVNRPRYRLKSEQANFLCWMFKSIKSVKMNWSFRFLVQTDHSASYQFRKFYLVRNYS